jgi:hypothetical protein
MQARRREEEQLIGDGVLVVAIGTPPQAAAAHVVPRLRHPREQRARLIEIRDIAGHLIGTQPRVEVPAVIVVEAGAAPTVAGERPCDDGEVAGVARAGIDVDNRLQGQSGLPRLSCRA